MTLPKEQSALLARLYQVLNSLSSSSPALALAFSGGVDSRFLAFAARKAGLNVRLLHLSGPHVSRREEDFARIWAQEQQLPLTVVPLNPLTEPRVAFNDKKRCYFCKKMMFVELLRHAAPLPLCDGSHLSDSTGYRPGRKALHELGIHSPLEMAGFRKEDIRRTAAALGMDFPRQKARPCLLTRFPYGAEATPERLSALDEAEKALQELLMRWSRRAALTEAEESDFRLRLASPLSGNSVELHIQNSASPFLHDPAFLAECRALFEPPCPLRLKSIVFMDSLSGYFDRTNALSSR